MSRLPEIRAGQKRNQSVKKNGRVSSAIGLINGVVAARQHISNVKDMPQRRRVSAVLSALDDKPEYDDPTSRSLERDVRNIVSIRENVVLPPLKMQYTQEERIKAVHDVALGQKTQVDARKEYGVPERTVREDLTRLMHQLHISNKNEFNAFCQNRDNDAKVEDALREMSIPKSGPKPYFDSTDRDILASVFDESDKHGITMTTSLMSARAMQYCKHMSDAEITDNGGEVTTRSKQLSEAKCGRHFLHDNFLNKKALNLGDNMDPKMTKKSDISVKRAEAADPIRSSVMTRRFLAHIENLKSEGKVPNDWPHAHQVEDWDEMGIDPDGNMAKGYSLFSIGRKERRMSIRSGEHASFWVSILYGAKADGTVRMPLVIHQGDGKNIRGDMAMNLDERFLVDATESGYCTRETMRAAAQSMNNSSDPIFVYLDGHDSHFDSQAMKYMLDNDIYPSFLKAQDSINDAALDNGVNAKLKAHYDNSIALWRLKKPGRKLSVGEFNRVFTEAWHNFERDPKLSECIKNAFRVTHTWPLVDVMENIEVGSPQRFIKNASISSFYQPKDDDHKRLQASVHEVAGTSPVTLESVDSSQTMITLQNATPGSEAYCVIIRSAAAEFFNKEVANNANDVFEMMQREKEEKKKKITRPAPTCLNPDTTYGLPVTANVVEMLQKVDEERKRKREEKDVSEANAERKRVVSRIEQEKKAKLVADTAKQQDADWRKLKVGDLKAAFKVFVAPTGVTAKTKPEYINHLSTYFTNQGDENIEP